MSTSLRLASLAVLVFAAAACSKSDANKAPAAPPADALTIEAFKKEFPSFSAAGKGKHVKIHGFAQTTTGRIAITDGADKPVPFAFCSPSAAPKISAKAHVVAEGTLDDRGDIDQCTLTSL